nr:PREDICTED: exosome complex component CSL4-like isoform X1 [Rhinolophus sinicus]
MAPPTRCCIPSKRLCNLEEASQGSSSYTQHDCIGCMMKSSENAALPALSVSSINACFAKVHVLYVGSTPLKNFLQGTIHKEDVRATEKDKVEIYKSLHPGDVVLAKVISLPDAQSNYLLTTAENELGVVGTHNKSSVQMVPISLCEMQCPKVHTKEFWKVA